MSYLEIILPLPLPGTFTYTFNPQLTQPEVGSRVIVQFGKRKIYTGVVFQIHDQAPKDYLPKEIIELLDDSPILTSEQLRFFEWISKYYMCSLGEVVNAALPAGLKISSESYLSINPDLALDDLELSQKEEIIIKHLSSGDIKMEEIGKLLDLKSPHPYIKSLKEKNAIQVFEQVKDKYTPKTEKRIRLKPEYLAEDALDQLSLVLEKKQKQLDALTAYLRVVPIFEHPKENTEGTSLKSLKDEGVSPSSIQTLIKNEIFESFDKLVSRLPEYSEKETTINLSPVQETAKREILAQFERKDTVLLKGITGSGKTEIYISIIQDILNAGGQVLYLLPEIALTTQIIKRLMRVFGNQFGVFHSKYSDSERVEVWQKVQDGTYSFVVGVRSSIFLPFNELSLVIIDEEHENSFKQYEPNPRYHARDAAIYLSSIFNAKTLLGTATPALETYHNALNDKYGLVRLDERFGQSALPKLEFANLIKERKQRKLKGNFSSQLLEEIQQALDQSRQVILFQNRRGYAPFVTCHNCGFTPKCPHCDVSLTYHIHQNLLICHYCGYRNEMITECVQCQSNEIRPMSFGTEKLEEELEVLLPQARIRRMDLDTTRSKYSYQKIIEEFEQGEIDILVGTQMVSKGLDFEKVNLVGVFDTDRMINFPDFRSHERAFQLIHQVSGRAGRRLEEGKVIIQTNDPDQVFFSLLKRHDYEGFYQSEILEREKFHYPPFFRLIMVIIKDQDKQTASDAAQFFAHDIRRELGNMRVIGPVEPLIGKIRNQYLYQITIKIEKQGINLPALKEFLLISRNIILSQRLYKSVRVIFDVDPV